ncbi:myelin expression factor 2-like isoform X5 [Amblyraja radiata]|uniref:myelin expression factor 2-like isoform X5 n=1 Tax=Amblyraja radiata TaxID=386614 RepID=UPI001401E2B1|nr:myelin expression factor 2-like isoform X5 [Amblyraja radiata]
MEKEEVTLEEPQETRTGDGPEPAEKQEPDKTEEDEPSKDETSSLKDKSNRFHPYSKDKTTNDDKKVYNRNRVFINNIPFDTKWQFIKDLIRKEVGDVIYVELFKDAEGKSMGCGVVEFKTEDLVAKALDVMNNYELDGRELNIKQDAEGEHARKAVQRGGGGSYHGGPRPDISSSVLNLPLHLINNPNIPAEVLNALQAGRLLPTVFVANLDFKVGWKKLKEVFAMAGTVKRANVKEGRDGKSRGLGTVTFELPLEAIQAVAMFNGQLLLDRPMLVKMEARSLPHDDFCSMAQIPQLPSGLGGIGMGLGLSGQPIAVNEIKMNNAMGIMASGGSGMDGTASGGINQMGGGISGSTGFSGEMDVMKNVGGYGGGPMGSMGNMDRMAGMGTVENFKGNMAPGMGNMGGMGSNMSAVGGMGSGVAGMGSSMGEMYRAGMASNAMGGSSDREFGRSDLGVNRGFGDSFGGMGGGMGGNFGGPMGGGMGNTCMDIMASALRGGMGGNFGGPMGGGMGNACMDPMASALRGGMGGNFGGPMGGGMGNACMDPMASALSVMAAMNSMAGGMAMGMDCMGSNLDRMGPGMGAGTEMNMNHGFGSVNTGSMGSGLNDRSSGFQSSQIFVRNLSYNLTWQKLKERFDKFGQVVFAEIKMENGKSKGCGIVRFDSPEVAKKACILMNGAKINGRVIDVRMDPNA